MKKLYLHMYGRPVLVGSAEQCVTYIYEKLNRSFEIEERGNMAVLWESEAGHSLGLKTPRYQEVDSYEKTAKSKIYESVIEDISKELTFFVSCEAELKASLRDLDVVKANAYLEEIRKIDKDFALGEFMTNKEMAELTFNMGFKDQWLSRQLGSDAAEVDEWLKGVALIPGSVVKFLYDSKKKLDDYVSEKIKIYLNAPEPIMLPIYLTVDDMWDQEFLYPYPLGYQASARLQILQALKDEGKVHGTFHYD